MLKEVNENCIAVILVNYNGINDTLECIKSLEDMMTEVAVIVVDNASKNDETKILKSIYPKVNTIRSNENKGFGVGNNIGIRYAMKKGARSVLLLNNDTIVDKYMLNELLKYECDDTVLVPKMLYYKSKNKIWYGGGRIHKVTGKVEHINFGKLEDECNDISRFCTFATGCCMYITTDILEKVGLFSDGYFMYCEDTEFCLRLLDNKIRIKYVNGAKLWHKIGASSGGEKSDFENYYISRNSMKYIDEHKNYFWITAKIIVWTKINIKLLLGKMKGNKVWRAYKKALYDYKQKTDGKTDEIYWQDR